ncbi:hypothetical protein [Nonomuraea sp. SBT364]|uniref:hypothetical protein n=1 Tax=Nonomuraea sp. SBT364 TaxID=1580530 RepID=UPI000A6F88E2|nr:hypothetical protein [Nonomuraea sp. SBT364]
MAPLKVGHLLPAVATATRRVTLATLDRPAADGHRAAMENSAGTGLPLPHPEGTA